MLFADTSYFMKKNYVCFTYYLRKILLKLNSVGIALVLLFFPVKMLGGSVKKHTDGIEVTAHVP